MVTGALTAADDHWSVSTTNSQATDVPLQPKQLIWLQLLHELHQCRTLLWKERRIFRNAVRMTHNKILYLGILENQALAQFEFRVVILKTILRFFTDKPKKRVKLNCLTIC